MIGEFGGMLPRENLIKTIPSWCNLGVPKYVITILKMNILRLLNQQQRNLIAIFFSQIHVDVHAIRKRLDLELKSGVWGAIPSEAEEFF